MKTIDDVREYLRWEADLGTAPAKSTWMETADWARLTLLLLDEHEARRTGSATSEHAAVNKAMEEM